MRWCTKRFGSINLPSILMPGTRRGSQELSSQYKLAARGTSSPPGGCASATNARWEAGRSRRTAWDATRVPHRRRNLDCVSGRKAQLCARSI